MGRIELLFKEEAEARMAELVGKLPERFGFGKLPGGLPFFSIPWECIVEDDDGSITWSAREIFIGMHSFIELTLGRGEKKRTIYLPFCLIDPLARRFAADVARTTVDPESGRYNSKPAELLIVDIDAVQGLLADLEAGREGPWRVKAFKIEVKLEALVLHLLMSRLLGLPLDRWKSRYCPFCTSKWIAGLPKRAKRGDEGESKRR